MYRLHMTVWLCDTPQAAQSALEEYHINSNAFYHAGTLTGTSQIGDACEACTEYLPDKSLIFLAGKIVVLINADPSRTAISHGVELDFPDAAIEAVAYEILLRASQQPDLTGVTAQQAQVAINGQALPKAALLVDKQVYVPVQVFAKAMGLTSQWDSKTGALTLSGTGRKTVALTATNVGGAASAALKVPVLKQAGQPVMTLDDLLTLTGGRVTGRSGNTVQVKA